MALGFCFHMRDSVSGGKSTSTSGVSVSMTQSASEVSGGGIEGKSGFGGGLGGGGVGFGIGGHATKETTPENMPFGFMRFPSDEVETHAAAIAPYVSDRWVRRWRQSPKAHAPVG